MKKYFLISILAFCSCQINNDKQQVKSNCANFRKGKFFQKVEGDSTLYKIERGDTLQKEIVIKSGDFVNAKINWTSECEYELTFLNQHFGGADSINLTDQKISVKVKITRVTPDSCFFESYEDDQSPRQSGVIYN